MSRLEALLPSDADKSRRQLGMVIDDAVARLEELLGVRVQDAQASAADAPDRIANSSHLERRYVMEHRRALDSTVNTFLYLRAAEEAGKLEAGSDDPAGAAATHPPRQPAADSNPRPQKPPKRSSLLDQLVAENLAPPDAREAPIDRRTELIPLSAAPAARGDTPVSRNEATAAGPAAEAVPPPAAPQAPLESHSRNEATAAGRADAPVPPPAAAQAPMESHSGNEATAAGPAATPVPRPAISSGPQPGRPEPASAAPPQRPPDQNPGPTPRAQLTTDNTQPTPRKYPPRSPVNWELIPETQGGDFQRYKDYQRKLLAEFGVSSPEEIRRTYRKDPPPG
jgi:hypothetical protein